MSLGALIEKFRSVALDRIEKMNLTLVLLERSPGDEDAREELLREIHTLKGEAKMMGFADINLVAHQTEHLLTLILDTSVEAAKPMIDAAFEGLDIIRALLTKAAGASNAPIDLAGFIDRVNELRVGVQKPAPLTPPVPPPALEDPGARRPDPPEDMRENVESGGWTRPGAGRSTRTRIQAIEEPVAVEGDQSGMLRIQAGGSLRVELDKLERLGDVSGEVLLMSRRVGHRLGDVDRIRRELRDWLFVVEGHLPKSQLGTMRNLVHQLDSFETSLREAAYQVNMRSAQLDEQTRRLRHVPLAQVLSHYPRAVRDLAKNEGKRVRLVHAFGSVEVDRAILSALSDPLLHLVRNAVDHGIEPPKERAELGKEPEGEIRLTAEYVGDSIRVVLSDDGRGIDPEAVLKRAVERGLVTSQQAGTMSDHDAVALIFEPGFTTKKQVDDLSGRGIGMDIVRRHITRLGGFIEIESEVGLGTSFMLHLPVSSAVSDVLMVRIGQTTFGLPAKDVERVDIVEHGELRKIHGGVCLRYDGDLVALVDWAPLLGLDKRGAPPAQFTVILVRKGARRVAVWVDEVLGEREAISRPLGEFLSGVRLCRGMALTDAAEVVPLLNVVELMGQSPRDMRLNLEGPQKKKHFTAVEGNRAIDIKTILVVEDSEITRALIVSILKGLGYRVIEADDGHHGWNLLQRHKVDLVLTDIQMPGMSGLELLTDIRASPTYARLPVVILTTLGEPEDKQKAMRLGANGYLVKLNFQEKELVDTVRRYL
ncbi:MAG: response regulator [Bradymonadaceae bacterium]